MLCVCVKTQMSMSLGFLKCVSGTPFSRGLPLVEMRQTAARPVSWGLPSSSSSVVNSSLEQMLKTFTSISVTVKKEHRRVATWQLDSVHVFDLVSAFLGKTHIQRPLNGPGHTQIGLHGVCGII